MAVLRAPRRVLRPRFAPVGGWSLSYAPTRALRFVSHSCQSPRPLVAGAVIPRPVGAERFCRGFAPLFFVGYRLAFAVRGRGCFPPRVPCGVCQPRPRPDCPLSGVLFCRLPPPSYVVGLRPPMLQASKMFMPSCAGGCLPPSPPPECFSWLCWLSPSYRHPKKNHHKPHGFTSRGFAPRCLLLP